MTYAQFQQPPVAAYQPRPYLSGRRRAQVTVVLLIIGAGVRFLTIPIFILDFFVSPFSSGQEIGDNPAGFVAIMLRGVLGLAIVGIYIATIIAFLMWFYRVSNNVAAFGQRTEHSSGWAVGSFFVPIMNLFVPYQAAKDIWSKSEPAEAGSFSFASPPGIFAGWWAFWIVSNIANNIYFRMSTFDAGPDAVAIVGSLSEVLSIAAAVFAIMVVREIDRRQEARSKSLPQYAGPPPPPVFQPPEATNYTGPVTSGPSAPTSI